MSRIGESDFSLAMVVLVIVSVVLLIEGIHLLWQSRSGANKRKIERRLQRLSVALDIRTESGILKQSTPSALPLLDQFLLRFSTALKIEHMIMQAGLGWSISTLFFTSILSGFGMMLSLAVIAHQSLYVEIICGLAAGCLPILYVTSRRKKRLTMIGLQLPEAIDLLTRALRSGHALPSGLQMLGEKMSAPIAIEFQILHDEINFGISMKQALFHFTERIPHQDIKFLSTAILIHNESGGNLTEILTNLGRLIRSRLHFFMKVNVMTAEARYSAWLLTALPFVMGGLMNAVNPSFMALLLNDPMGIKMMKYALVMMIIGCVLLRRISHIKV